MIRLLRSWLPLLFVAVVAVAFRFPLLDSLPPGLNFDEGGEGVAALDVAAGHFRVMWPIGGGKEPLMAYLVQPLFWLFGPTRLALRLYTALWGVGAVLATYFLAGQLFSTEDDEVFNPGWILRWLPLFAGLGLATAFWHVAYSRIAFRALSNPAVEALALAFLWRGLRTDRWRDFQIAGFFTGGLIYTYLAGRFVPVALPLFFVIEAVVAWRRGRVPLLGRYWLKLAGLVAVAFVVFLPMGIHFLQNPGAFGERAGAVSIFSPTMNNGDFWGTLRQTTLTTIGTFLSLTGDPNPLGNIPGRPELGLWLAILFVFGWITAIRLWRQPAGLFLLIWWPIMLLPAILAPEDAPHHLRLIGTAPATYIFIGLGLCQLLAWVSMPLSRIFGPTITNTGSVFGWGLALVVFGLTGLQTYRDYFVRWAGEVDHYMAFDVYAEELADQMAAETSPDLAYAIPMDLRAAHEARHYSLDFLYRGRTPFYYIVVDEMTAADALTEAARNHDTLKVVRWTADKHQAADEKEIVAFLLETAGARLSDSETHPVYNIETYRLPSKETRFSLPVIDNPIEATLDDLIQIRRATVLPQVTLDHFVAVAVTYAPIAPIQADYKASIRLIAPDGRTVAQKDRTLRHNWHQPTSLWPAEEVNEYYLLLLPDDAPAGTYEVRAVIYHPETLAPLTMNGQVEIGLGKVEIPGER